MKGASNARIVRESRGCPLIGPGAGTVTIDNRPSRRGVRSSRDRIRIRICIHSRSRSRSHSRRRRTLRSSFVSRPSSSPSATKKNKRAINHKSHAHTRARARNLVRKTQNAKRTGATKGRGASGGCRGRGQRSQQLGVPKQEIKLVSFY